MFKNKFGTYYNYKNLIRFISEYEHHKYYYNLIYNVEQYGGNIEKISEILKQYNVQIDELESNNKEIKIQFFTINNNFICLALIINNEKKFATISDLHNYPDCIPSQDENLIKTLIKFSCELAKKCNMTHLELSDNSYYTCKGDNPLKNSCNKILDKTFKLSMANTLTNDKPYYYKYGFTYKNIKNHKKYIENKKILKMKTFNLDYIKLMKEINHALKIQECDKEIRMEYLRYVATSYENHKDNNIKEFFKELKFNYCFLFCLIYETLWDLLNLEYVADTTMQIIF